MNSRWTQIELNWPKVKVTLRLVSGTHLGPATNFAPSLFNYFRHLWVCWCGAPSLTRSRVCSFQFLPGIASAAFLTSESHGTHGNILLSLFFRLSQPGGPGPCIYFPQEQGSPVIPPAIGSDLTKVKVKFKVVLRPTISRSVRRGVRHPSGARDQFFGLLEIFLRQLRVCYFVAPSLTRGRVCNLLLLLVLATTVPLGSESRGTQDHILLSQFLRLPQPGWPGPRIYVPQEQGGPDIPPGTEFPFCRPLRLAELRWRYSIPPSHGNELAMFKLDCDRRSVCQFVLVSCPFWSGWPDVTFVWVTIIFYFFFHVGRPLWRKDGLPARTLYKTRLLLFHCCKHDWYSDWLATAVVLLPAWLWLPNNGCVCHNEISRYGDWLRVGQLRSRSSNTGRVKNFHFSTSFRPVLRLTQPHSYPLAPGVKWPVREADHWTPTSAEAKKTWIYTSTPPFVFMA
jgi:hypothetical protein